jgi:asparagine synthase (glutamine-hydrolysing)
MCGILGWTGPSLRRPEPSRWQRALASIAHRGPDGEGTWSDEPLREGAPCSVLLGHRRLAILDLSDAAAQPMVSPRSGIVLVFNGQIFNHQELRRELADFPYRGHGDTEVLLAAIERWGEDAAPRLRGMFAFAWWDPGRRLLGLARDRMGVKPLYFGVGADGSLAFASETRALARLSISAPALSPEGMAGFLAFGSVQEPHTVWKGVQALEPGSVALWEGQKLRVHRYWDPAEFVRAGGGRAEEIGWRLGEAVRLRLEADVPLGVFLSSGIDSAAVAYEAHAAQPEVEALTLAFAGHASDESGGATHTARHVGLRHRVVDYPASQIPALFAAFVAAQDQPSVDGLNTWMISRAAREAGFKVMLTGTGGDELFFGYPSFRRLRLGWLRPHRRLARLTRLLPLPESSRLDRLRGIWEAPDLLAGAPWLRSYWGPDHLGRLGLLPALAEPRPLPDLHGVAPENRLSWYEVTHYLRDTLLRDIDAMSMAHGLEVREPYMDHRVVECALSLSPAAKWGPQGRGKAPLRASYRNALPAELFTRAKRGFELPYARWLAEDLGSFTADMAGTCRRAGLPEQHGSAVEAAWARREIPYYQAWQMAILRGWLDGHVGE